MNSPKVIVNTDQSELYVVNNFLEDSELFDDIINIPELIVNPSFMMYGKPAVMHRTIGFLSDETDGYPYSGQVMTSISLSKYPKLKELMNYVNEFLNTQFNGILINIYPDGHSYIGPHSDDEKTLHNGIVAGISLGVSRIFRVKNKLNKTDVITQNGQLIVMTGNFQKEFTHEIPKQIKIKETRISLTFRCHSV